MKQGHFSRPAEFLPPLAPCNAPIRRCGVPRDRAAKRILIMRAGAHGDIVMGTPLLSALRDAYPDGHFTWIVERKQREAIDANPLIDEVLLWDSEHWRRLLRKGRQPLWLVRALQLRAQVRRRRYDLFISLQPEEWPLLARIAAPVSIGVFDTFRDFSRSEQTSPHTRRYTTAYTHADLPPHRTDQYLLPLRALGLPQPRDKQMRIGYTSDDAAVVDRFLRERGIFGSSRFLVLAPMTTWASRCWPAERYAQLGDALVGQYKRAVLLIGSGSEREAVERVAERMSSTPILAAGVLRFRQMAALLDRADLLVSGDTGPMHVAAAVGTPYVALFGPTPAAGRAPLAGRGLPLWHPVACGPCDQEFCANTGENHMACMRLLTVAEVLEAASRLLQGKVPAVSNAAVTRETGLPATREVRHGF